MDDAMVVARMSKEKKESVARKLAELGTSASGAINQLYDYIERTGSLPFNQTVSSGPSREERVAAALSWIGGLQPFPEGNRFQGATDEDIRAARLGSFYEEGTGA